MHPKQSQIIPAEVKGELTTSIGLDRAQDQKYEVMMYYTPRISLPARPQNHLVVSLAWVLKMERRSDVHKNTRSEPCAWYYRQRRLRSCLKVLIRFMAPLHARRMIGEYVGECVRFLDQVIAIRSVVVAMGIMSDVDRM